MKLRLRANTIRLRLLKTEVERLSSGETLRETLPTPQPFHFAVRPAEVLGLAASFEANTLTVDVPRAWSQAWLDSDEVGCKSPDGAPIEILIEKDWACTSPRSGLENTGTYPNPTV